MNTGIIAKIKLARQWMYRSTDVWRGHWQASTGHLPDTSLALSLDCGVKVLDKE